MLDRHKLVTRIYMIKTYLEIVTEIIASEMCNKLQLKRVKNTGKIMFPCQLSKNNLFTDHEEKRKRPFLIK